jgi:hypothetical protein
MEMVQHAIAILRAEGFDESSYSISAGKCCVTWCRRMCEILGLSGYPDSTDRGARFCQMMGISGGCLSGAMTQASGSISHTASGSVRRGSSAMSQASGSISHTASGSVRRGSSAMSQASGSLSHTTSGNGGCGSGAMSQTSGSISHPKGRVLQVKRRSPTKCRKSPTPTRRSPVRKNGKNSGRKYPQLVEALRHEIIRRGGFWQGRGPMPANLKYVTRAETCAWLQTHGLSHSAADSILREAMGH